MSLTHRHRSIIAAVVVASLPVLASTQARTEVTINDTGTQAENLTSSQDGSVYFRGTVAGIELYEAAVPASGGSDVSGAFMIKNKSLALGLRHRL